MKIGMSKRGKVNGVGYCSTDLKGSENGKQTRCYITWVGVLSRGYIQKFKDKFPTYQDVTVCEEWHDYQNFHKWYQEHYYELDSDRVDLDKDILVRDNKVYSPETCRFVPVSINLLLNTHSRFRGDSPQGVCCDKKHNKYVSHMSVDGKVKHLGYFSTPEEAFEAYKEAKESHIKVKANEYKDVLPIDVYEALMNWEIK